MSAEADEQRQRLRHAEAKRLRTECDRLWFIVGSELNAGRRTKAIDAVYSTLGDALRNGELRSVSEFLRTMRDEPRMASMPLSIPMSALTATRPWRKQLGDDWEQLNGAVASREPGWPR